MSELSLCKDADFNGIHCLDNGEEYGFEGCYGDRLNHPDPRPAHRIWIKKLYAEKLFKLFEEVILYPEECPKCNSPDGWSNGYCSMCGFRKAKVSGSQKTGE